ncbi:unnamed protein product [Arctogadus glacialis]
MSSGGHCATPDVLRPECTCSAPPPSPLPPHIPSQPSCCIKGCREAQKLLCVDCQLRPLKPLGSCRATENVSGNGGGGEVGDFSARNVGHWRAFEAAQP